MPFHGGPCCARVPVFPPIVKSKFRVFLAFQIFLLCGSAAQPNPKTPFVISAILRSLIGVSDAIH